MDVDRGAIKAVEVSRGGGDSVLRHVGYHRLPPGTIVGGEVADVDLLAEEIKEFWSSHSFGSKSVVLGVANQKVVVRILNFPRMDPADLEGAVGYEAQDHIPMPLDDAVVDHVVLGPRGPGSDEDRVLVVAAHKQMVARYTAAVRAGGLRPAGVDVKALALTRSTLPSTFFAEEGAVLLLDVGTELSSLAIVQDGHPAMSRSVRIGLGDFLEAVADAADLPEEEAEKLALDPSMRLGSGGDGPDTGDPGGETTPGSFDPALAYDVRRGLEGAAEALAEEVSRSVEHHGSEPGAREVSRVLVSGEGALVPGLWAYLGELLGVATGPGSPTEKLAANRSNVSDEQLGAMEPVLAVAIGLAMEEE